MVTAAFAQARAADLDQLTRGRAHLLAFDPGAPPAPEAITCVNAAFLSTDLMQGGAKQNLNPALAAFSAAVEAAGALQWLHTCASGTDRPLLQQAMRRGVTVTSSTGANADSVAANALAGLLALARGVPRWVRDQEARFWRDSMAMLPPTDLAGQHAVIVGTGAIGTRIARACRALGLRVTGVRRKPDPLADFDAVAGLADFDAILPTADWLILCCPLNDDTRGLVNAARLARLPSHAGLVNVSRGEVVVEGDLFAAVLGGHLGGIYADVFITEPLPPDSPWWTLPRALVSPHNAGVSKGFAGRTQDLFLANLDRWLSGRPLAAVAGPSPAAGSIPR